MHLKNWFLGLCLIVLLAGEFFLFSANRQKEKAQEQARAAAQEAAQARAELEQLTNSIAAQLSDDARLRVENESLSKKLSQWQNENSLLRATNRLLSKQLGITLNAAQQQQDQLQQLAAENQQVRAVAEQTLSQAEQALAERNTCINNLRQIDVAKNAWALENNKTTDAVPTEQDLSPYFNDQTFPVCPSGGAYTIGAVGVPPTCSIPGHAIPQPQ
jgi:regulator of replication initiation timing